MMILNENNNTIIKSISNTDFRSISSENKGFKMLSKLGWQEGQTLGKNNDGLLEPVSH